MHQRHQSEQAAAWHARDFEGHFWHATAGYTPLHMAVGYSRTTTVQVLLDFGADPEVGDKEGRTVVELVEKLRAAMPLTPELLGRRTMLEDVAGVLTGMECYELASSERCLMSTFALLNVASVSLWCCIRA